MQRVFVLFVHFVGVQLEWMLIALMKNCFVDEINVNKTNEQNET